MFGVDLESVVVQPNQPLHWERFCGRDRRATGQSKGEGP